MPEPSASHRLSPFDDRARLARVSRIVGIVGLVAAVLVAVGGWILAGRAARAVNATIQPVAGIVVDVSEAISASELMVARLTEAIDSIEMATRSTGRTLDSVGEIIGETAAVASGGIAESLESAVDAMPALVSTGRVVDRTMRALSLVGVDYDPEVPLDEALTDLEESLAPIPDQIRAQVEFLETVQSDIEQISDDAGGLAAVLLQTRIDMMEAERVLGSAAEKAAQAAESVATIETEVDTYDTVIRLLALAAGVALAAGALGPLLMGIHLGRSSAPDAPHPDVPLV